MSDQAYDDWLAARYPGTGSVSHRIVTGRRRRLLATTAAAAALALLVGYGFLRYRPTLGYVEPAPWAVAVGLTLTLSGLVLEITALVRVVRSGRFSANRSSRLWALTRRQRREVLQQARGRRAVTPDELPFVRDVARQVHAQRWLLQLLLGLLLMQVGQSLIQPGLPRLFVAVCCPLLLVSGFLLLRDLRLSQRFLERTSDVSGQRDLGDRGAT